MTLSEHHEEDEANKPQMIKTRPDHCTDLSIKLKLKSKLPPRFLIKGRLDESRAPTALLHPASRSVLPTPSEVQQIRTWGETNTWKLQVLL